MTVFILSDVFNEAEFLYNINATLKSKFDKIVFLRETHCSGKNIIWNCQTFSYYICDSIEECIMQCDLMIIIKSENIPQQTIIFAKEIASNCQKQYCYIDKTKSPSSVAIDYHSFNYLNKPTILILSTGMYAMPYCIESEVNKILSESSIKFKQIYLPSTENVLSQLYLQNQLDRSLENRFSESISEDYSILVISLALSYDLENVSDYPIEKIRPDYIILATDGRFNNEETAQNIIKYRYKRYIDMIIKSPFALIDDYYIVNLPCETENDGTAKFLVDNSLGNKLKSGIFTKIALPEGIKRI